MSNTNYSLFVAAARKSHEQVWDIEGHHQRDGHHHSEGHHHGEGHHQGLLSDSPTHDKSDFLPASHPRAKFMSQGRRTVQSREMAREQRDRHQEVDDTRGTGQDAEKLPAPPGLEDDSSYEDTFWALEDDDVQYNDEDFAYESDGGVARVGARTEVTQWAVGESSSTVFIVHAVIVAEAEQWTVSAYSELFSWSGEL